MKQVTVTLKNDALPQFEEVVSNLKEIGFEVTSSNPQTGVLEGNTDKMVALRKVNGVKNVKKNKTISAKNVKAEAKNEVEETA